MARPWFRMYSEIIEDVKVQMMPEAFRWRWVEVLCLRCEETLDQMSDKQIAFRLRITEAELRETKAALIETGLIDQNWRITNWSKRQFISDNSTQRSRRFRQRQKEQNAQLEQNKHATLHATPRDAGPAPDPTPKPKGHHSQVVEKKHATLQQRDGDVSAAFHATVNATERNILPSTEPQKSGLQLTEKKHATLQQHDGDVAATAPDYREVQGQKQVQKQEKQAVGKPPAPLSSEETAKSEMARGGAAGTLGDDLGAERTRNKIAPGHKPALMLQIIESKIEKWLSAEVRKFWGGLNRVEPEKMPWRDRDTLAIRDLIRDAPSMGEDELRRCLEHRSISVELGYLPASVQPSKWLRGLPGFLSGPLDKENHLIPMAPGGGYKRKGR